MTSDFFTASSCSSAIRALVDFAEAVVNHAKAQARKPAPAPEDHPEFAHLNAMFDP
jgi:hypothetical protein